MRGGGSSSAAVQPSARAIRTSNTLVLLWTRRATASMAERRAQHEQRLWACAQQDLVETAASILQQFAELLHARTSSGQTLVHVAAAHTSRNVLQLLLKLLCESRAEPNGADAQGKTPLLAPLTTAP